MTTLDKTGIEAARDEFVHSTTKEQIERWAYKWADDLLSTADALSSLPAQAVGVGASVSGWTDGVLDPTQLAEGRIRSALTPSFPSTEQNDGTSHASHALAPSQPAAVGVTGAMIDSAAHALEKSGLLPRLTWEGTCDLAQLALEAALRSTP